MNKKKFLIISDAGNKHYWDAITNNIGAKANSVHIILNQVLPLQRIDRHYDVIIMDISHVEDLFRTIPEIHAQQPKGRIIVVTSTPTWKFTREVLRLGAADLVRKDSHLDLIFEELSHQYSSS
jgi:DNA-binding NarL/FixJ family response regulator